MARYVVRNWIEDEVFAPDVARPVAPVVDEGRAVDTGLLSVEGHPIMRIADPIGFGRRED